MALYYFCPESSYQSAGVRILYRHVEVLVRHGINAAILHVEPPFKAPDTPDVPIRHCNVPHTLNTDDLFVIPEPCTDFMQAVNSGPNRRFVIALNWDYIFNPLKRNSDWKSLGIERVLTHSPFIADLVIWSMGLPSHVFQWGIHPKLYFPQSPKKLEVAFIDRKQTRADALKKILASRNPRFATDITWTALRDLTEIEYAAVIRRASIFLNLSPAEGLPCSLLEAMRCRTLVAGYNSVGGQDELIPTGPNQNAILVENLDYPTLARHLEPILLNLLKGDSTDYVSIIDNAFNTSLQYDWDAEEASILSLWQELLKK
jgi:glycosyltransferase involved in cell wall biosynthesis